MKSRKNMHELEIKADKENLIQVLEFLENELGDAGFSIRAQTQIAIAAEEIFINIVSYAYQPGTGIAKLCFEMKDDPARALISFIDSGTPYDPLAKEDPDITLLGEERPIGGLGIYMVKQSMDDVVYEYKDGCNILTLVKCL